LWETGNKDSAKKIMDKGDTMSYVQRAKKGAPKGLGGTFWGGGGGGVGRRDEKVGKRSKRKKDIQDKEGLSNKPVKAKGGNLVKERFTKRRKDIS